MRDIHRWACAGLVALVSTGAAAAAAPARGAPVVDAAKNGDRAHVAALVRQGADVNAASADGTTALHWAAYREDPAIVDVLLRAGARVQVTNRYGATPLWVACTNGNAAVVDRLLKAGADANTALPSGETALMTASRSGNAAAVTMLVQRGAKVNAQEPTRGQTALMWAAAEGHAGVIKALAAAGADLHAKSHAPAGAAMTLGFGMAATRVSKRIDAFTPLLFAAQAGRMDGVRALLDAGADVNETAGDGTSALVIAAANAHWEVGAFLLERGADPNSAAQGWTALHQVIRTRNLNLGYFPHPESTGRISSLDLAQRLIERGAKLNARMTKVIADGYRSNWGIGATPLIQAAKGADYTMMRLLAANGADPAAVTDTGATALMAAAGVEMINPNEDSGTDDEALAAVKLALELGNDVNAANKNGDTALHGAAWRGSNAIVQLLVDRGARLDARNKAGLTPLRVANGEEVSRGVNVNTRPWTVELMTKLLKDRGLPIEMASGDEKKKFFDLVNLKAVDEK